jgi:hypothetical protein
LVDKGEAPLPTHSQPFFGIIWATFAVSKFKTSNLEREKKAVKAAVASDAARCLLAARDGRSEVAIKRKFQNE